MERRILLLEDNDDVAMVVKEALEGRGFEVEHHISPQTVDLEAMEFKAILTDHDMPGMTGIEFLRKARAAGIQLPVIMYSARVEQEIEDSFYKEGGTKFFDKTEVFSAITLLDS